MQIIFAPILNFSRTTAMKILRLVSIAFGMVLVSSVSVSSIATTVRGIVTDGDNLPLPGAAVQLIMMPDTVSKGFMLAGDSGDFQFEKVSPGDYWIMASMVSMADAYKKIKLQQADTLIDVGRLQLKDDAITLQEAVVTAVKAAVVAKQDTLEFNAGSFSTSSNATVSDLLKKLPGVEVGSDGSITSNGKTITKILVDGKEFFGDDPQMATKNLPSNMVDKVQVVDRKSDLARLTGVDDGEEETVINLTVKKDMNNGWFGNVSAGYGTDSRYQGSFVVNNFNNGNQITILGGLNNINDNGFTDRGRGRFRDFGGNNGINTSQRLGLNFNVGNEEKFRIGGNVLYSHSDRISESRTATQYLFPDSVSLQNAYSNMRDKGHNINSDFRIQWNIDEYNTIDFRPNFSMNIRDSRRDGYSELIAGDADNTMVNTNTTDNSNRGTSLSASGNLIYNHKFRNRTGRSFSLQAGYTFSNTRQRANSWSNMLFYLLDDSDETLFRFDDNHTWSNLLNTRLTWTEPLGNPSRGNYINIAYSLKYQWNNADKLTYNLPLPESIESFVFPAYSYMPQDAVLDNDLSNSFRNEFFSQELQVGYKKVSKKLNIDAGMLFSPSSSSSENLIDASRNIPARWVWNVSPYARIRWKIADRTALRAHYRARTSQPSMSQLQPVADVTDPLNVIVGNPDLKPTFTQNIGLHFNDYKVSSQQSIFAMINASFALNSVTSRTIANPETGGRTTTYTNVNGNLNLMAMGFYNRSFTNRHWRMNARLMARYASTPGYINGDYNRLGQLTLSPTAGVTYSCDVFQMTLNPAYTFSSVRNTLPNQANRVTHAYGFNADATLTLPFGLNLNTDLAFSKNSGYTQGFNYDQWLWNAEISYSFLRDKSLTFAVRAYDILGQKKNVSRTISASTIVDNEYNDLTRYVMFSLTWNFNTLNKRSKGVMPEDDGLPMPPPDEKRDGGHSPLGDGPKGRGPGGFGGLR